MKKLIGHPLGIDLLALREPEMIFTEKLDKIGLKVKWFKKMVIVTDKWESWWL